MALRPTAPRVQLAKPQGAPASLRASTALLASMLAVQAPKSVMNVRRVVLSLLLASWIALTALPAKSQTALVILRVLTAFLASKLVVQAPRCAMSVRWVGLSQLLASWTASTALRASICRLWAVLLHRTALTVDLADTPHSLATRK